MSSQTRRATRLTSQRFRTSGKSITYDWTAELHRLCHSLSCFLTLLQTSTGKQDLAGLRRYVKVGFGEVGRSRSGVVGSVLVISQNLVAGRSRCVSSSCDR